MSKRTAVYWLYDANGMLLYIGMTENPDARFAHHESTKPWWPEVDATRTRIEWHETREEAAAAEDELIRTERTVHNVARSPWAPRPRVLGPNEMSLSDAKANFSDVVQRVRLLDRPIVIVRPTRDRTPQAAIVPTDVLDLIEHAGGLDRAREILKAQS